MMPAAVFFRLHRVQLLASIALCLAATAAAVAVDAQLEALQLPVNCLGAPAHTAADPGDCAGLPTFWALSEVGVKVLDGIGSLSFVIGVLLGAPLVSREIEHRTAALAWSLAPSRRGWLIGQLGWLLVVAALLLLPVSLAAEMLSQARHPDLAAAASFQDYGLRGPLLVLRALPVLCAGALIGLLVGRSLPALIAASVLAAVLFFAADAALPALLRPEELVEVQTPAEAETQRVFGQFYRDDAGSLLSLDEVIARSREPAFSDAFNDWVASEFSLVTIGLPGERYPEAQLREGLLLVTLGTLLAAGAVGLISYRRPY